ncbi:MAG: T9SS type A sorting domain-containing protein [Saprospiraceae bacterium]|nr:T9SS type A sorting domain-containing protein [Saprospiraceae bacterium]
MTRAPRTTVVDIIVNSDVHNTLEAAVGAAGLVEALSGEGPFTVFAPTDAAFAALPAGTVEALLADIPALTNILLYHVLAGEFLSQTVLSVGNLTFPVLTLQGTTVNVTVNNGNITVNNANVTVTDLIAENGVVHVIDAVLLPTALVAPTGGALANGASKITAQIAPNPTSEVLNLSYQVESTDRINIALMGANGKLVKNIFAGVQESGAYNLQVAVNDLAAGIYFVSIQTGEQFQVLTVSVK